MVADRRKQVRRRSIVLVGFMGCGKSTVGRALAAAAGLPFVDVDREIEQLFGVSIPEIFSRHGEPAFRATERELVGRLVGGEPQVLSVGGGAFIDPETRHLLNAQATTVWLDPPFDVIVERIARSNERPLASSRSADELHRLWEDRRGYYAEAHIRVPTEDGEVDHAVHRIMEQLA
jgi:shikimate kinase